MKKFTYTVAIAVFFALLTVSARADDEASFVPDSLRVTPMFSAAIVVGGEMGEIQLGNDRKAPGIDDVYDMGWGGGVEVGWRLDENWEVIFGLGAVTYAADTVSMENESGDRLDMAFDDVTVIPMYVGLRILFSSKPEEGLTPYVRGDIGAVYMTPVDVEMLFDPYTDEFDAGVRSTEWWDGSMRFMYDLGGGFEYRFGRVGVHIEGINRFFNSPKNNDQVYVNHVLLDKDGGGWGPVEIRLGVSYYF